MTVALPSSLCEQINGRKYQNNNSEQYQSYYKRKYCVAWSICITTTWSNFKPGFMRTRNSIFCIHSPVINKVLNSHGMSILSKPSIICIIFGEVVENKINRICICNICNDCGPSEVTFEPFYETIE